LAEIQRIFDGVFKTIYDPKINVNLIILINIHLAKSIQNKILASGFPLPTSFPHFCVRLILKSFLYFQFNLCITGKKSILTVRLAKSTVQLQKFIPPEISAYF